MYCNIAMICPRKLSVCVKKKKETLMKQKIIAAASAIILTACLCACGGQKSPAPPAAETGPVTTAESSSVPAPEPSSVPAPELTPEPSAQPETVPPAGEPASPVSPGSYIYDDGAALWTLTLRADGPYTLRKEGDAPHTGESWTENADGTVSCSPTDLWAEPFADGDGCTRWVLYSDGRCQPVFPDG